jgi:outer membrane protein assembly factor BamB
VRFARENGEQQEGYSGGGGAYALLADEVLVSGPGRGEKAIVASDVTTRETLALFDGLRMLVNGNIAYLQSETELSAFNRVRYLELSRKRNRVQAEREQLIKQLRSSRKDTAEDDVSRNKLKELAVRIEKLSAEMSQCYLWTVDCDEFHSLILAGDTLIVGGRNRIAAIEVSQGREIWSARVEGTAYGLSLANGRLFASTDQGVIHCFSKTGGEKGTSVAPISEPHPYPKDRLTDWYAEIADQVVRQTAVDKGYCLVLGSEKGRLALELAKRTQMQIVCVEEDLLKVAVARQVLDAAGYYGSRITVHHGSLEALPYPSYFANLIVSEKTLLTGEMTTPALEVYRLLRPYGGCLCIGQQVQPQANALALTKERLASWCAGLQPIALECPDEEDDNDSSWIFHRRGALKGVGEWTQLYCDAGHTACSEDQIRGPLTLQWFGAPGPQHIIDRHHRPMSSLVKDGRVFIPADNRIIAADAYNGTQLWELEVPRSRRIGAMKDAGQMLLTDDLVYIASGGECWGIDVATGKREITFPVPNLTEGSADWGYLNRIGNRLVGSGQKRDASFFLQDFHNGSKHNGSYVLEGDFREVITSDYLFSFDRHTRGGPWTYRNGSIMNSAIAIGDNRIYFSETRNPDIVSDPDGRIRIDRFCEKGLFIVALDLETGRKLWERPFSLPFEHIMFINYADDTVLLSGTYNVDDFVHYGLIALHGNSGQEKWRTDYLGMDVNGNKPFGTGGSHGEQWQHPVINGSTVYSKPYAYDLHTGQKKDYVFYRGGHGCGGFTGSVNYMYGRGSNPRMYPLNTEVTSGIPLTQVTRPGCWLNIIPAGGLILLPESSSGCTCAYSVQTSLAFAPREYYAPPLILTPVREFRDSIRVELADRNGVGTIRYTLDGSDPNDDSPLYTGAIVLTQTTTVKAKTHWDPSQSSAVMWAEFVRLP